MSSLLYPVSPAYSWVLMSMALISVEYVLFQFFVTNARKQHFGGKFMKEHFPQYTHMQGGYPDMGSGKFAEKLSMDDWIAFNSAQRAHQNFLENLPVVLVLIAVGGLYLPKWTVTMSAVYGAGRLMYALGYVSSGPKGRMAGAITFDLALIGLLVGAIYGTFTMGGGISGFTKVMTS